MTVEISVRITFALMYNIDIYYINIIYIRSNIYDILHPSAGNGRQRKFKLC
jgi:hypothetical protein